MWTGTDMNAPSSFRRSALPCYRSGCRQNHAVLEPHVLDREVDQARTGFDPCLRSNQCLNDPDGAVDHDERLKVTGVTSGSYDARLTLADGRTCLARNIQVELGKPFSIEDKDLIDCSE